MSKKLLPIILVLFVAGAAVAGDMDYKVYGKIHMSMQMVNNGEDSQLTMSSNTSRFGIKGKSEMTDTMCFIWQFESFINPADAGGTLSNRNSFVGVKTEFGSLVYGIHDTPFKTLGRKTTFFYDTVGDNRTTTMGWDRRVNNVVMYTVPKNETGVVGQVAYRMDQNAIDAEEAASTISAMGGLKMDQFFVGAAIEMDSKGNYVTGTSPVTYTEDAPVAIRVAGKFDSEAFGGALFGQVVSNAGGVADLSQQTLGVEGCFHMAEDMDVKGLLFMADPNTDTDDNEYMLLALGLDKKFPKKLTAYAQFSMLMNGDNAAMGLGGNGWGESVAPFIDTDGAKNPWAFSVGFFKKW